MSSYRQDYIDQLEEENRQLVGEMYDEVPHSDAWLRLRGEVRANREEIEIMKKLIETAPARPEAESTNKERMFQ